MSLNSVHASSSSSRCRVALLGFGTVGSAVARRLSGPDAIRGVELTRIFDRRAAEKQMRLGHHRDDRGFLADVAWTDRFEDVVTSDVDVVIELIGGVEPAAGWIRELLGAGKSVVTANKQVIARHGPDLLKFAARQGRQLRFEAAVGGAMPIVRAVGEGLAGDRVTAHRGDPERHDQRGPVADGIDRLGDRRPRSPRLGPAAMPRRTPRPISTASMPPQSSSILCGLAFGLRVDPSQIDTRSSASIGPGDLARAHRAGGTIRQIAHAEYDRAQATLTAWVAPVVVPRTSIFGRATGPQNAALITSAYSGEIGMSGAGAGGDATAVAILSDLGTIARDRAAIVPAPSLVATAPDSWPSSVRW